MDVTHYSATRTAQSNHNLLHKKDEELDTGILFQAARRSIKKRKVMNKTLFDSSPATIRRVGTIPERTEKMLHFGRHFSILILDVRIKKEFFIHTRQDLNRWPGNSRLGELRTCKKTLYKE